MSVKLFQTRFLRRDKHRGVGQFCQKKSKKTLEVRMMTLRWARTLTCFRQSAVWLRCLKEGALRAVLPCQNASYDNSAVTVMQHYRQNAGLRSPSEPSGGPS
jgi:hypothetical protein